MIHELALAGSIHNTINYYIVIGLLGYLLRCKKIAHRKLVWALLWFAASHAMSGTSVSLNIYYNSFPLLPALLREIAACFGTAAIAFAGVGIADLEKTLELSQVQLVQTQKITDFLDHQTGVKINEIDQESKRQNRDLAVLLREG